MKNTRCLTAVFLGAVFSIVPGLFLHDLAASEPQGDVGGELTAGKIYVNKQLREYLLYVPAGYNKEEPVPLLINFHGYSGNAYSHMRYADFRPVADTAGFFVVCPQGLLMDGISHWNVGGWTEGSVAGDISFISTLIDSLSACYSVDRTRVFCCGFSNGGFFSFRLAFHLGQKISAIASVSGTMTTELFQGDIPDRGIPLLFIHGTDDRIVDYEGASGLGAISVPVLLDYWANLLGLNKSPRRTLLPDVDPDDGCRVEKCEYGPSDKTNSLIYYRIINGNHSWPGAPVSGQNGVCQDVDACAVIWEFFSSFR